MEMRGIPSKVFYSAYTYLELGPVDFLIACGAWGGWACSIILLYCLFWPHVPA